MKYPLELVDQAKFEKIINAICREILGIAVISFAPGKDGGKDGKFEGLAQKFPSKAEQWSGKFIIQAKHTENPIASCSDNDFKSIIKKEIHKIKKLKENNEIDCYILFTNRKYTGIEGEKLLKKIQNETEVKKSIIIGKETINEYLCPKIIKKFELNKLFLPFKFSDKEIKNIILAFKEQLPNIKKELRKNNRQDFNYIEKKEKNKKNKLGENYFKNEILAKSSIDFVTIESFLNSPKNEEFKDYYFDIASELSNLISIKRDSFEAFEEIFVFIYQEANNIGQQLQGSKRHIWTLLHYMYYECLIGIK